MSYTELFYVTPKKRVVGYAEFHNSHLGAMQVWVSLYKRYFEDRIAETKKLYGYEPYGPMSDDDYSVLCGLFKNTDIPIYERAVLASTFDRVILEKEHFNRFSEDVLKFVAHYPAGSLIDQTMAIQKLSKRNIVGVCWNQTSVNADMYSQLKEWAKCDNLWSLYKELDLAKIDKDQP